MHYVTRRSHRMQKHKFSITCPSGIFVESMPVPHENEIYCVAVSGPECTRMHYVTHISQRTQKHKFSVTCPDTPFVETNGDP
jgi:hypothetical protein